MDKENNYCYDDYIYALFIEDKLQGKELENFIEHLRGCEKCLYIVSNLFKDLRSFESTPLLPFPKHLLQKNKNFYLSIKTVYSATIKKIKDKIEVLKHSYPEHSLIPALSFKGKNNCNGVKFHCDDFNIELFSIKELFDIVIYFNNAIERKIKLFDNKMNLIESFHVSSDSVKINDIKKGEYTISFDNTELNFLLKSI